MTILAKLLPADSLSRLPEAICNPYLDFTPEVESLPAYNGLTGDLLFRSPTPGARRVSRQRLRRLPPRRGPRGRDTMGPETQPHLQVLLLNINNNNKR